MKNFCFIVSHFYSGSSELIEILNQNSRCEFKSGIDDNVYDHPDVLNPIINQKNKIFGDQVLKNYNLPCKRFYDFSKFIYVIRSPRGTFADFFEMQKKDANQNIEKFSDYYRFRLRRICEMAKKTKSGLILNWEDLKSKKAFPLVEEYLEIKLNYNYNNNFNSKPTSFENETLIRQANKSYEKYHYFLKNLNQRVLNG